MYRYEVGELHIRLVELGDELLDDIIEYGVSKLLLDRVHLIGAVTPILILDLEERGLLDRTLVVVMGEMGRTPKVNKNAGRDHWPQCGFALLAGGGVKRGVVVGKTDKHAAYPTDRPVSAGDMVATIYQLLGINPSMVAHARTGRPIGISHGGAPVWEAIA